MRFTLCVALCALMVLASVDGKKSFSSRRKSGGNNSRRGGNTNHKPPPAPAPASTPQRTADTNNHFLNAERAGSSHGSNAGASNTHYRGSPFDNKPPAAPQPPKQTVPQTNGPIGFDKVSNQQNKPIGFDKVNSDAQHKPSAPAYPVGSPGSPPYPAKPAGAPNGPPPAYGAAAPGSHGGFDSPPAYPGRPVNAPPVYSANHPGYHQTPNQHNGYQQSGVPHQQAPYPQQAYNPGYQQAGGQYPNQGYPNQGFGGYPNQGNNYGGGFGQPQMGGFGQPNSFGGSPFGQPNSYGGSPFGGSPFGQPNHYGGSPFGGGFGGGYGGQGNSFGGFGNNYSPNSFGYSSKPGLLGSLFGGGGPGQNSGYGYHKRSRFGGLPIPIPIPIPIPLGGFGMFGGRSHNHRVLETFVNNQTVNSSDNSTNVYILNNSTVTPCTTDQFIYESLNVTVMSCTAESCVAIKVFTTSNISGEVKTQSAGITMCLEGNTTYSSFADNINPTVSELNNYWMRVCKDGQDDATVDVVESGKSNTSDKGGVASTTTTESTSSTNPPTTESLSSTSLLTPESASSTNPSTPESASSTTPSTPESASLTNLPTQEPSTSAQFSLDRTRITTNSSGNFSSNTSPCETFDCSSIQMCLPSVEIIDRCLTQDCPQTKTSYRPCVNLKMCKSPTTQISTIATLNNTLTKTDQNNAQMIYNDVANLTLISYIPTVVPTDCSQNAKDSSCQTSVESSPEAAVDDVTTSPRNADTPTTPLATSERPEPSSVEATTEATTSASR